MYIILELNKKTTYHEQQNMKRKTWRKHHKWVGIVVTFFLVMFCLSGIVLNHRQLFADINVSRGILPSQYEFSQWNNGLLRGTLRYKDNKNHEKVFIYGAAGIIRLTQRLQTL